MNVDKYIRETSRFEMIKPLSHIHTFTLPRTLIRMKLSKVLKAFCDRIITPNSCDKPEPSPAPANCHATPIYDSHRTIPYRAYNPNWNFRLPATNHDCEFLLPVISRPIPLPPPLPSSVRTSQEQQHVASPSLLLSSTATTEYERQSLQPEDLKQSTSEFNAFSDTLPESRLLQETVLVPQPEHELAAYRTPTETLSSRTTSEPDSLNQYLRNGQSGDRNDRQSFEEDLQRLSSENERQQVYIYDLVARLKVAERRAQELVGASRLTRQRKLKTQISGLIEELQTKETEVEVWVARYSSAMLKAQIGRDGEGREFVREMREIKKVMAASNGVLQNLCWNLENRMLDVEWKERAVSPHEGGLGVCWSAEESEHRI